MPKRRVVLLGSLLAVLVAAATIVTPLWVMQPFRSQGPRELVVALGTLRLAPWLLAAATALALWMVVRAWPEGWLRRVGSTLALIVVLAAAWVSRINVFEEMFAPLPGPQLVAVADAPWSDGDVMMTVRVGEAARAYPVRVMAYHHVLNDVLGQTPLVVTY
jgi:hypothetical protein